MTEPGASLKVGWKVSALDPGTASLRYRALLPVLALQKEGVKWHVFRTGLQENLEGLDALVIVKSFTAEDISLAQLASERGIRVVFDLCDDVFIPGYGAEKGVASPAQIFAAMAGYLDCVVTTTEPLAERVRAAAPGMPVHVIPDGIETPALTAECVVLCKSARLAEKSQRFQLFKLKVGKVIGRLREEGIGLILPLSVKFARRALKAAGRKRRQFLKRMSRRTAQVKAEMPGNSALKRIVWFGNHGAAHARFGMLDLLEIREALETVAREHPVELVVISNNRGKYESHIKPLAIPSRYVEWSPGAVDAWLGKAAAVVLPNSLDAFSICKSANRTVLALAHGAPVVATRTPALDVLAPFIHMGDPLEGLRRCLAEPVSATQQAQAGYARALELFGQPAVAQAWLSLLQGPLCREPAAAGTPHTIVVLHLPQDLDLAMPIIREIAAQGREVHAWCSASLIAKSPRVMAALRSSGIAFRVLPDEGSGAVQPLPASARALLTVAETNLRPHRFSHALAQRAQEQGLFVGTLQHGFENVGLTYDDDIHPIARIDFKADRIYTWGPHSTLHPRVGSAVKLRCLPVGCPKEASVPAADLSGLVDPATPVIGIFENLHWHRYDDGYRQAFLDGVRGLAQAFPSVCFLVKPHHAGLWLTTRYKGDQPVFPNLVIADPQNPVWENHTAPALLGRMGGVITTPSTVALDAARLDLPVAVFAGGLSLANYEPLPLLSMPAHWKAFVDAVLDDARRPVLQEASAAFVARVLVPGNAAKRIASDLAAIHD